MVNGGYMAVIFHMLCKMLWNVKRVCLYCFFFLQRDAVTGD